MKLKDAVEHFVETDDDDCVIATADLSKGGRYRYSLSRTWDENLKTCAFIGLNPSTADAFQDDPTIRRCRGFAKEWGYGSLIMVNLFAYRATSPLDMRAAEDPVPLKGWNEYFILKAADEAELTVACWGNHGGYLHQDDAIMTFLKEEGYVLACLGRTKKRKPKHPLYLSADTSLLKFTS